MTGLDSTFIRRIEKAAQSAPGEGPLIHHVACQKRRWHKSRSRQHSRSSHTPRNPGTKKGRQFRSTRTKVTRYPVVSDSAMLATEYQERLGNSAAAKAWLAKRDH